MDDIKIAFFDLDGTLLNHKHQISDRLIRSLTLLKNKGIVIALASGRTYTYVKKIAAKVETIDYLICNNGSIITDKDKVIYEKKIDDVIANTLWQYASINSLGLILNTSSLQMVNRHNHHSLTDNYQIIDDIPKDTNIYQMTFTSKNKEAISSLLNYLEDIPVKIAYVSKGYYDNNYDGEISVDVINNESSKGIAIMNLLTRLNLSKENAICFGDNVNDLEMFDTCETKVAMSTSMTVLSAEATYITNDISNFINEYLL